MLDYLTRRLAGTLRPGETTLVRYPTAIEQTLGFTLVDVGGRSAVVQVHADVERFGNQQGTIHGGFLCELADAAIGTAHSTVMRAGESFTSTDLVARFLRPSWSGTLTATATCTHAGRTLSQYLCEVTGRDGRVIASVTSAVMTLRGDAAKGR
ncbi:uncharacterized domain 1-containing protein [Curtobacterium sp. 314Chir4.1]|uniref:PaaI family thioesterase n=1 Tax=Curtobacterium sp. 314Chir4.1 TaxID=1279028 RepID=UPI000BD718E9|nr:PaaI family thioesterase [Curtobacterium sp. 314Chir4.1]SOC89620.1 uncharacterized domain 1-containing protein [Curtobacterium sp. 314Chir4.1]